MRPIAIALLAVLAMLTLRQGVRYRSAIDLWERTLADNPAAWSAMTNLGNEYASVGRFDEAIGMFERASAIPAARIDAYGSWGNMLLFRLGKPLEAIEKFRICVGEDAKHKERSYANLSLALHDAGRIDEAIAVAKEGLLRISNKSILWHNLAEYHLEKRELESAETCARRAVELDPDMAAQRALYGNVLAARGRFSEAEPQLRAALAEMTHLETLRNLVRSLMALRKYAEALRVCRESLPNYGQEPAILLYSAWIMATCPDASLRDGPAALTIAREFGKRVESSVEVHDTLAAAYAETGDFAQAVAEAQKALDLARARNDQRLATAIGERLDGYRLSRPYRLSP